MDFRKRFRRGRRVCRLLGQIVPEPMGRDDPRGSDPLRFMLAQTETESGVSLIDQ